MSYEQTREKNETVLAAEATREEQREALEQKGPAAQLAGKPDAERATLLSRLITLLYSISVRYKIAGMLIVVLGLAVVSLGVVTFRQQHAVLRHEMKSRAETLTNQLANVGKEGLLTKQELPVFPRSRISINATMWSMPWSSTMRARYSRTATFQERSAPDLTGRSCGAARGRYSVPGDRIRE